MSQNTSDPNAIERDLDQTRSRLNSHLSVLQRRLTPGQVVDDLMRYFHGREGADFGRSLADSVRSNPLPAAITGIGLTWLMASNPRAAKARQAAPSTAGTSNWSGFQVAPGLEHGGHEAMAARVREAEQNTRRGQDETEQLYTSRLDSARGQALGLARHGDETRESFGDRIRSALASAQQAVSASAHDLRGQASDAASSLGSAAQGAGYSITDAAQRAGSAMAKGGQATGQTGSNLFSTVMESPVLLGALGLAAGALLGALLPQLEQEEATLGKLADQVRDTAKGLAQEAVDKGEHVAQVVLDKSGESAEAHGLTGAKGPGELVDAALSGDLAKDLKEVATDVLHSGDDAVRKVALGQDKGAPKPI